jgi:hypothetical protein
MSEFWHHHCYVYILWSYHVEAVMFWMNFSVICA